MVFNLRPWDACWRGGLLVIDVVRIKRSIYILHITPIQNHDMDDHNHKSKDKYNLIATQLWFVYSSPVLLFGEMNIVNICSPVHVLILFTLFTHCFTIVYILASFSLLLTFINFYNTICLVILTNKSGGLTPYLNVGDKQVFGCCVQVLILRGRHGVSYWLDKLWFLTERKGCYFTTSLPLGDPDRLCWSK